MDGIIDILIAVLFIAIPTIFKAIGNKLEKAGSDKAGKFKKVAEAFADEDGESTIEGWLLEKMEPEKDSAVPDMEPAPVVVMKPVEPKPMMEETVPQIKPMKRPEHIKPMNRKPIMFIEDEPKKKTEKIDPKKLVIYSEIMKPKF